ncbi:hypothetical protein BKI52_23635 [marine bacterium AO1-C]|nr:hypothetical protein BKI52_23635 [marine bacterium AO1-C]
MTDKPKIKADAEHKDVFRRREPFNFMLWTAIVGISIMFFALTLLYVARKGTTQVMIPSLFWLSTFFITLSSITLWRVNVTIRRERFRQAKLLLGATLALGLCFIGLQVAGWQQLISAKIYINNNLAGSFIYIISGLHIAHILGGLVFLSLMFVDIARHKTYVDSFIHSVNPPNQLRLKLVTVYWHFVDILWWYLFGFFLWF